MTEYSGGGFGGLIDWGTGEIEDETAGDLPIFNASGEAALLGIGSASQVLGVAAGAPAWQNPSNIPIGGIIAWHKTFTNTPALPSDYVECSGQTLSDAESVYDGQVIPDLNAASGTERFLRGQSTSGGTGGSETHTHSIPINNVGDGQGSIQGCDSSPTGSNSTLPSYFEVVWVMRIK